MTISKWISAQQSSAGKKAAVVVPNKKGTNPAASIVPLANRNPHQAYTASQPKPVVDPILAKMTEKEQHFYDYYSKQIANGSNDVAKMDWYNNISKKYGAKKSVIGNSYLQQLSIKALSGDKAAQAYLKSMAYNPLTGQNLWKGYDTKNLSTASQQIRSQYMKDNPLSDYTKNYDMSNYQKYNDLITGNKPMTDDQIEWYKKTIAKWHLDDMNDPYIKQQLQMDKDKQAALDAQDSALNNSMATLDMNNFNTFQQLQQDMSERGMGDSGIASDAYTRMQMGANRDYQDAFVNAQQSKADIQSSYTDKKNELIALQNKQNSENAQLNNDAIATQNKEQLEKDKFLTSSTGMVYANGKPVLYKGKPITTIEYKKLTETQRHNLASENNIANGNQLDYSLGLIKNDTAMLKIQADIQKAQASLQLGYDKLDKDWAVAEMNLNKTQEQLTIAARNASSTEQSNAIKAINGKISALKSQIKKGKPTAKQKEALKKLMKELDGVLGKE